MNVSEIAERAREELVKMTKLTPSGVIGTAREDNGWMVTIEMVEKKSIPDSMDILGTYEVKVNDQGQIADFQRVKLRKRCETVEG
jgi:hypothetical protein